MCFHRWVPFIPFPFQLGGVKHPARFRQLGQVHKGLELGGECPGGCVPFIGGRVCFCFCIRVCFSTFVYLHRAKRLCLRPKHLTLLRAAYGPHTPAKLAPYADSHRGSPVGGATVGRRAFSPHPNAGNASQRTLSHLHIHS